VYFLSTIQFCSGQCMSNLEKLETALKGCYALDRELGRGGMAKRTAGWTDGLTDVRV